FEDDEAVLWSADDTGNGVDLFRASNASIVVAEPTSGERLMTVWGLDGERLLWRTDGTPQGTRPIAELNDRATTERRLAATSTHAIYVAQPDFDRPQSLASVSLDTPVEVQLAPTPGTSVGSNPSRFVAVGQWTGFIATDPATRVPTLWRTDGTPEGTHEVAFDTAVESIEQWDDTSVLVVPRLDLAETPDHQPLFRWYLDDDRIEALDVPAGDPDTLLVFAPSTVLPRRNDPPVVVVHEFEFDTGLIQARVLAVSDSGAVELARLPIEGGVARVWEDASGSLYLQTYDCKNTRLDPDGTVTALEQTSDCLLLPVTLPSGEAFFAGETGVFRTAGAPPTPGDTRLHSGPV